MTTRNYYIGDLRDLLVKFLTKEQEHQFIATMTDVLALSPDVNSMESLLEKYFSEYSLSDKKRMFIDTLITYMNGALTLESYLEFVLEFSKINLIHGENDISFEISNLVLNACGNKEGFELLKANSLLLIAEYYMRQAIWKESVTATRDAQNIFESLRNKTGLAKCEFLLGTMYTEQGILDLATARLENSLSLIQNNADPILAAMIAVNFGNINYMQGDYKSSLENYNKAAFEFDKAGDKRRKGETLQNIGLIHKTLGDFDSALKVIDNSIETALEAGYAQVVNLGYLHKTEIYLEKNDLESAYHFSQKTLELSHQLNDRLTTAEIHKLLGVIARKQEKHSIAVIYLLTSLRLNAELFQELNIAETNYELGLLNKSKGDKEQAKKYFNDALKYYKNVNNKSIISNIESELNSL